MIEERILSRRLADDGQASLDMNRIRSLYAQRLNREWREGQLRFDDVTQCPCGGRAFIRIVAKDRFGLPFSQLACKKCGLLNCQPRLSEDSVAYYYDALYHPLNYGAEPATILRHLYLPDQGERIFHFLEELLPSERGSFTVAEVGCGCGGNLELFAACCEKAFGFRPKVYGCEFSRAYVEDGRKRGLDLTVGDAESLREFGATFDVIIMSHVVEHFTDLARELAKVKTLANPETRVFVEVPGICDLKTKFEYGCDVLQYLTHSHLYNFNLASLTHIMGRQGYRRIKGNERVQAAFLPASEPVAEESVEGNCDRVIEYLRDLEANRRTYLRADPNRRFHRRVMRLPSALARRARRLARRLSGA